MLGCGSILYSESFRQRLAHEAPNIGGAQGSNYWTCTLQQEGATKNSPPGSSRKTPTHQYLQSERCLSPPPQFQCCLMAKQTPDINGRFSLKPSCARNLHNIEIWGAGLRAKTKAHTERWAFFVKNPDSGKSTLLHAKHTRVTCAAPAHTHTHTRVTHVLPGSYSVTPQPVQGFSVASLAPWPAPSLS